MLTGEGGGPQGYLDGCQRQEVAGLHAGGGWAPKSLGVHRHHGGRGGDGNAGAAANGLQAVVTTTCRRETGRSAQGCPVSPRGICHFLMQHMIAQKTRKPMPCADILEQMA